MLVNPQRALQWSAPGETDPDACSGDALAFQAEPGGAERSTHTFMNQIHQSTSSHGMHERSRVIPREHHDKKQTAGLEKVVLYCWYILLGKDHQFKK